MATLPFDRQEVEQFLESVGNTNFQIIARGSDLHGASRGHLIKQVKYLGGEVKEEVRSYRTNIVRDSGQDRTFSIASQSLDGGDVLGALATLLDSYFDQIELSPLSSISRPGLQGDGKNPFANIEPLLWIRDIETGKINPRGGARPGAGRPSIGGRLISVDLPTEMIAELDAEAEGRGISRAQLMRERLSRNS